MNTFQINVLIQFLAFSSCFQHHVFNIRKTICTWQFCVVCFSCIYVSRWKDVLECVGLNLNLNSFITQFTYVIFENCFMKKRCFELPS